MSNPTIGWREWVSLPALKIAAVKAKVDTGARTSSLHAFDVETYTHKGTQRVRFQVHPIQRNTSKTITCDAELIERRLVRSSTGRQTLRPVIMTTIELLGHRWDIELTLTNRDDMGFRMLLGREAVRRRFVIDPGRSFLTAKNTPTKTIPTRGKKRLKKRKSK